MICLLFEPGPHIQEIHLIFSQTDCQYSRALQTYYPTNCTWDSLWFSPLCNLSLICMARPLYFVCIFPVICSLSGSVISLYFAARGILSQAVWRKYRALAGWYFSKLQQNYRSSFEVHLENTGKLFVDYIGCKSNHGPASSVCKFMIMIRPSSSDLSQDDYFLM